MTDAPEDARTPDLKGACLHCLIDDLSRRWVQANAADPEAHIKALYCLIGTTAELIACCSDLRRRQYMMAAAARELPGMVDNRVGAKLAGERTVHSHVGTA